MPDHRYGYAHKRMRKRWAPKVRAGKVICARCGEPIRPGAKWDLDHDDANPRRYLGPSHRRCNRASVTHLKAALTPEVQRHSREW